MVKSKRHLLSYLAGVFDGEGCISISRKRSYQKGETKLPIYYDVRLTVQMTDPSIPRLFLSVFGGSTCVWMDKKRTRPIYRWALTATKCGEAIKELMPYTILKRPQMEVALSFLTKMHKRGKCHKLSNDDIALRQADYILMRKLKEQIL